MLTLFRARWIRGVGAAVATVLVASLIIGTSAFRVDGALGQTVPSTGVPAQPTTQPALALNLLRVAYVSGANPLTEGQPTRITFTYEVRNLGNVPLDFNGTVVIDLGNGVAVVSATPTRGMAMVTGRRIDWDGFILGPSESASITVTADVTPPAGSAGRAIVVVEGVLATARTPAGSIVEVRGGAITSDLISGLANGGLVTARAGVAATGPAPVAPGTAAAAAAPPPAGTGGPVGALPRTGTGLTVDSGWQAAVALAAALAGLGLLGGGVLWVRQRSG